MVVQAALVVVDEHAGIDVYGICRGQRPLSYTTLIPVTVEDLAAIGRALSDHN
jgi:hypothetical protein